MKQSSVPCENIFSQLDYVLSIPSYEACMITLVKKSFLLICINLAWTQLTKYTQLEVEGRGVLDVLKPEENEDEDASSNFGRKILEEVAYSGRCTCFTSIHVDKYGKQFVDFICSYPRFK